MNSKALPIWRGFLFMKEPKARSYSYLSDNDYFYLDVLSFCS
jgi:hypothetical protein